MLHRRSLPLAHPCSEASRLRGDGPVLHCDRCDAPVYDLSALTRAQAEAFLHRLVGRPKPCLRYTVDARGALRFRDPQPGAAAGWVATLAAGAVLALAAAPASAAPPDAVTTAASPETPETQADATPTTTEATEAATTPGEPTTSANTGDPASCPLPMPETEPAHEVHGGVPPDDVHHYGVSRREHRRWRRAERRRERRERRAAQRGTAVA